MKLSDRRVLIGLLALAIPFLAMLLMIGTSIRNLNHEEFRIGIEGSDPRDILRGHYMVFNYRWTEGMPKNCIDGEDCCACLSGDAAKPDVSFGSCRAVDAGRTCKATLDVKKSWNNQYQPDAAFRQYYIPEARAKELETLLRSNKERFKVGIVPQSGRRLQVKMMYIDDMPLPEFLKRQP
jgi:hypothetical protein